MQEMQVKASDASQCKRCKSRQLMQVNASAFKQQFEQWFKLQLGFKQKLAKCMASLNK